MVGESKFLTVPITKQSWQAIFTSNAIPTSERPDLTGFLATTLSVVKTFTFFDFNKTLTQRLNEIFWRLAWGLTGWTELCRRRRT